MEIKADELFSETKNEFFESLDNDYDSQEKLLKIELLSESELLGLKATLKEEEYNKICITGKRLCRI